MSLSWNLMISAFLYTTQHKYIVVLWFLKSNISSFIICRVGKSIDDGLGDSIRQKDPQSRLLYCRKVSFLWNWLLFPLIYYELYFKFLTTFAFFPDDLYTNIYQSRHIKIKYSYINVMYVDVLCVGMTLVQSDYIIELLPSK